MAINELNSVPITVKEIVFLWGVSKKSVMWAIWRDKIRVRQCTESGAYLIDMASCYSYFGECKHPKVAEEIRKDWYND